MTTGSRELPAGKKLDPGKAAAPPNAASAGLIRWSLPLLIAILTLIVFLPSLQNGFVNWDDLRNLVDNVSYRGLGWPQLSWMFTNLDMGHYQPLSWVTLGLDYVLWGMNPFGYHLTSLVLHGANAVVFYFVARRLLSAALRNSIAAKAASVRVAAGFGALLFALHPLRVESVAWATERRGLLAGLFFLLSALCYLRANAVADGGMRLRWMAAAVTAYGFSLLSKASGIALPIVFLALDTYPLGRLEGGPQGWLSAKNRRVLWEKGPFLVLALVAGVLALMAEQQNRAVQDLAEYGVTLRIRQVFFGLTFYLWKTLVPSGLSPVYAVVADAVPAYWWFRPTAGAILALSVIVDVAVSVVLFLLRRRWPAGLTGWVCYVAILAPVLGVVRVGAQIAADRYSYIACLGWAALAAGGLLYCWRAWLSRAIGRNAFFFVAGMAGLVLVGLGVLSWRQTHIWRDTETLWRHALTITPRLDKAHFGLAFALHTKGELEGAIQHYRKAIQLGSGFDAHNNLAIALSARGELHEAIREHRRALNVDPTNAKGYYYLANALVAGGEIEQAIRNYRQALKLNPAYAEARNNLAGVLAGQGELGAAIQEYRKGLEIDPTYATGHYNLANALVGWGEIDEAIRHFREALKLNPAYAEAHNNLGGVLAGRGDLGEAIRHFREALKLNPADVTHYNLANALARRGELEEAIRHYREALVIQPTFAEARKGLTEALARQGRRDETTER